MTKDGPIGFQEGDFVIISRRDYSQDYIFAIFLKVKEIDQSDPSNIKVTFSGAKAVLNRGSSGGWNYLVGTRTEEGCSVSVVDSSGPVDGTQIKEGMLLAIRSEKGDWPRPGWVEDIGECPNTDQTVFDFINIAQYLKWSPKTGWQIWFASIDRTKAGEEVTVEIMVDKDTRETPLP